jgi:hypothetical protein
MYDTPVTLFHPRINIDIAQVNPQLKGHLKGALNGGAKVEEVKAVRDVVIRICEASGMKKIGDTVPAGWGWRGEVANL